MKTYPHIEILNKYVADKLITVQKHKVFDYYIYNYSQTVQFQRLWDEVTIDCRGLILNGNGEIIARPFRKFFNLEEHNLADIPFGLKYTVFEKMDGSLGITYKGEDGMVYVATRGSFESDQAIKATDMMHSNHRLYEFVSGFSDEHTFLFEIIYPNNKIVVDYANQEKLVLLGSYNRNTQEFLLPSYWKENFDFLEIPQEFFVNSIEELKNLNKPNFEGYVIRFDNDFRIKVKLDEYVRLHRLMTNISNVSIWESMKDNKNMESFLVDVPDEFYGWVKSIVSELQKNFSRIEKTCSVLCEQFSSKILGGASRADAAKWLLEDQIRKQYSSVVFSMVDDRNYTDTIWKMIRPSYQKPFYQKDNKND